MLGSHGLEPQYFAYVAIGIAVLILFGRTQLKIDRPMLRVDVFKNKQFLYGNILVMILNGTLIATASLLPMYLEDVLNQPAITQAIVQLPGSVLVVVLAPIAGRYQDKHGARRIVIFGFCFLTLASIGFSLLRINSAVLYVTLIYFVRMFGFGCVNMPTNSWAMKTLDDDILNHATSINNTLRQVSAALSTAIVMSIANFSTTHIFNAQNIDYVRADLLGLDIGFAFCVLFALFGLVMSLILFRKGKKF